MNDSTFWFIVAIAIVIGACGGVVSHVVGRDNKAWRDFKVEHQCNVVSRVSGDVVTTFGVSVTAGRAGVTNNEVRNERTRIRT